MQIYTKLILSFINSFNKRKSFRHISNIYKLSMSTAATSMKFENLFPPIAPKKPHVVYFGINPDDPDENRGENPMNPPIEMNDNYYWLRDDERKNPEIIQYLNEENDYYQAYMRSTEKFQEEIYNKMLSNLKETDESVPYLRSKCLNYYYTRTVEGVSYPFHCRRKSIVDSIYGEDDENKMYKIDESSEEVIVLDENALAKGFEYTDVGCVTPSPNEQFLAYSVDHVGSEHFVIHIRPIDTECAALKTDSSATVVISENANEDSDAHLVDEVEIVDVLKNTSGSVVWNVDNKSLFYLELDSEHRPYKVFKHVLGTVQSEDKCLYTENDGLFELGLGLTSSEQYLLIMSESKETSEVLCLKLEESEVESVMATSSGLETVRVREPGVRYSVDHYFHDMNMDCFFIITNIHNCLEGQLMYAPTDNKSQWINVCKYDPTVHLEEFFCFKNHFVLYGRENGLTAMWVGGSQPILNCLMNNANIVTSGDNLCSLKEETFWKKMKFDEECYEISPSRNFQYNTNLLRIEYTSLVTPRQTLLYNMSDCTSTLVHQKEVPHYDPSLYCTKRIFAKSRDGHTSIPISIVYRKDVVEFTKPDCLVMNTEESVYANPTTVDNASHRPFILTGYGSYGCSSDPYFDYKRVALLDYGVMFGIAHIRGGNEMGRYWYEEEGKFLTKKNTFEDFVDCGQHLVDLGITAKDKLGIVGRSAGGLLIGSVVTMEPSLFRVAVADVPFVDVMVTMCDPSIPLTVLEWEEWGNPNENKYFDYIKSYSPIDNIQENVQYPAMLVTTGLHDPRVAYWEGAKFVSKIRATNSKNILLLKTDMSTGHFSASDRYKYLKEMAIEFAFMLKHIL